MWAAKRQFNKEIGPVFIAAVLALGSTIDAKIASHVLPEDAILHESIGVPGIGGRGYIYSLPDQPDRKCLVSTLGIDFCR